MGTIAELQAHFANLNKIKKTLVVFGGSFNPACNHHRLIADFLAKYFDGVAIVPCWLRPEKLSANVLDPQHRKNMSILEFSYSAENIALDLHDFDTETYTPTFLVQNRYEKLFPGVEIWHAIGTDIVKGGRDGKSEMHLSWNHGHEIWHDLNFAVLMRGGYRIESADLPPFSQVLEIPNLTGSGTEVRRRIVAGESIDDFVSPKVKAYIEEHKLYQ